MFSGRARKNLNSFIPVPIPPSKNEDEKKQGDQVDDTKPNCNKCTEEKCGECLTSEQKEKDDDKKISGRKIKRPRKNRKAVSKPEGQCFFPMSMSMMYGPMGNVAEETTQATFPFNVTFKQVFIDSAT